MRTHRFPFVGSGVPAGPALLVLAACVPPEKGIDHTVLNGTVRVAARAVEERAGENGTALFAQNVRVSLQPVEVSGSVSAAGDADWYEVTSAYALETSPWAVRFDATAGQSFRVAVNMPDETGEMA